MLRFYFAVRGVYKQSKSNFDTRSNVQGSDVPGKTVKCLSCASYIASELSIARIEKGETLYFCSEDCKNEYMNRG